MASSMHENNTANGHRTDVPGGKPADAPPAAALWYGNGAKGVPELQRPRRLSFNGSDMELSDLKGHPDRNVSSGETNKNAIDTKQTLILLAVATTLAVTIRYLLPAFDLESYRSIGTRTATMAATVWQEFLDRASRLRLPTLAWNGDELVRHAEQLSHALYAVAFGLLLSSFTWYMIYLDSSIPGVNPPTPFSASKKRYRGGPSEKERRFHLPYITALLSGVVGFLIVLLVSEP
uniref:Uncharacterized protein n=1 Tax=Anopheles dirus TaxID=7168 RepID=A0A182NPI2_9DIPT